MVTDLVIALVTVLVTVLAGCLKALKRRNSVPRPKGFCEAGKVIFFAVLLQNLKYHDLCVIDTLIWKVMKHSVRGPASL